MLAKILPVTVLLASPGFGLANTASPAVAARESWRTGPPIEPRGTAGAVVHCGAIHVFGGESPAKRRSLGEVFRLKRDGAWERVSSLPTPRNFARAVILDNAVYVVGGSPTPEASHASTGTAIVERFRVSCGSGWMSRLISHARAGHFLTPRDAADFGRSRRLISHSRINRRRRRRAAGRVAYPVPSRGITICHASVAPPARLINAIHCGRAANRAVPAGALRS